MALSMNLWQIENDKLEPMNKISLNLEKRLKKWIYDEISILGMDLLIIGQEVHTSFGGFIDILAIDIEGKLIIIELKRDKTPRDIVAQCFDYGIWVYKLTYNDVIELYEKYNSSDLEKDFEKYFSEKMPSKINNNYQIIIVAESLDDSTERIVEHLNIIHGININAIFFNVFSRNGNDFIGRSWLKDPEDIEVNNPRSKNNKWTGYYFVNTGITDENQRDWKYNITYNFISAGGGDRWINAIKKLKKGDKIFALIKNKGYVGYGIVEEEAVLVKNYFVNDLKMINELPDNHTWKQEKDPSVDEWIVKVNWVKKFNESDAKWFKGAFANQNVVCKLKDTETFDFLVNEFGIEKDSM